MMTHARQRCSRIYIMSAKYGLIHEETQIEYYDTYLGNLTQDERDVYITMLAAQSQDLRSQLDPGGRRFKILSYLPHAYHEALMEADPLMHWWYRRPYAGIRSLTMLSILTKETKNYGINPARR